jgi:hypothetical protein
MESKKWLWVVIVCLAIIAVYQIVKLTEGDSAEPSSPEAEQAAEPDRKPIQTASLGELTGMLEERKPPANVEEPEQISAATTEGSEPSLENPEPDTAEPVEEVEEVRVQEPPVVDAPPAPPAVTTLAESSNRGLVQGVVYSAEGGSALIDGKIIRAGGTVDGAKILRIHAGGVDFEKNGHRWTQKVSQTPDPLWVLE